MCRGCIGDVFGIQNVFATELSRGRFIATSAAAAGFAAVAGRPAYAATGGTSAATVFSGGTILSMDERYSSAKAVAIANGTILAIGDLDDVVRAAGSGAQKVNLDGRTLMPGLIDPHQHPIPGGIMLTQMTNVGSDTYKTKADVLAALKAKAARTAGRAMDLRRATTTICCRAATSRWPSSTASPRRIRSSSTTSACTRRPGTPRRSRPPAYGVDGRASRRRPFRQRCRRQSQRHDLRTAGAREVHHRNAEAHARSRRQRGQDSFSIKAPRWASRWFTRPAPTRRRPTRSMPTRR